MRACLVGLLFLASLVNSVVGQKVSREETEVRAVIEAWAAAVRDRDQKALDALFADELFITDYNGGTRDKRAELDVFKPSPTTTTVSVMNEDVAVRSLSSKAAVVTAIVRMVFEAGGKQSQFAMCYTSIWQKDRGRWRLTVLHTSRVPNK